MEEEKKQAPQEELTPEKKVKDLQMEILDKMGKGGLNQNDLMAFMTMMQKNEPDSFKEMIMMSQMTKMMKEPQQDSMNQMMPFMMMDMMRGGGDGSELEKKVDMLQRALEKRDEDNKFNEVMARLKEMEKNKEGVGIKDILAMAMDKDKTINEIKRLAEGKDKELLINKFEGAIAGLQNNLKSLQGGNLEGLTGQIKAIKNIYNDLGLKEAGKKSKEEIISDLVQSVSTSLAPTINAYAGKIASQAPQGQPVAPPQQAPLTPEQLAKLQEIQAQRAAQPGNPGPQEAVDPNPPAEAPDVSYKDEDGDRVYPDLIQVSDSETKRRKK